MRTSLNNPGERASEYSTQNILKNAKAEKLLLDIEQFKVRTKKDFHHDVQGKDDINQYFGKINECIDQIVDKVADNLNYHRKDFFDRFKGEMYNIHSNYRELLESTNDDANKVKLKKEILDRQAERDWFKNECNKIDSKCHEKQDELYKAKDKHNECLQEKKFLDEQIATARENRINLNRRKQELKDLQSGKDKEEDPSSPKVQQASDPQYYE